MIIRAGYDIAFHCQQETPMVLMDVAGLEVEAGGQPLGGVEHRAGGLGGSFLEAVKQVAAALAEREDHVVAGMRQRAGDVGAALLDRKSVV